MKKVYKYGTGEEIPEGAVYLWSTIENKEMSPFVHGVVKRLVWHYFLVDVQEK